MKEIKDAGGVNLLKKQLKEGKFANLYVLYGEEVYLRDYYVGELKKKVVPSGFETFNLREFQGKDFSAQQLEEALDCLPMMAERTMVFVSDWDVFKQNEETRTQVLQMMEELPDYCTLVFLYDILEYNGDKRTKLATTMAEKGVFVNFARQSASDLTPWVQRRFRSLEKEISPALVQDLLFLCGDYMGNLVGEIEKIGAYASETEITKADIDAVATPHLDAIAFAMTDQMALGNFDRALKILGELRQMQEPQIKILGAVSRQIRQLYQCKLALAQGKNVAYVAQLLGVQNFVANKVVSSAKGFTLEWCRGAVLLCVETDLQMKTAGTQEERLTQLVLELANQSVSS